MSEWWSYRLSDFLLFSPRVYWRTFEIHNEAIWPLHVPMLAAGLAIVGLAVWRPRHHGGLIALLLTILWMFVGWSFLWQRYAPINWAALYVAPAFALEALLFVIGGFLDRLSFVQPGARRAIGFGLIAFALAGYPLLAPMFGRPWATAEIFGIAPDPTAIGTLGLLLLTRDRWTILLLPIPLLWCLAGAATLWAMAEPQGWVPLGAALLAASSAGWPASQRRAA